MSGKKKVSGKTKRASSASHPTQRRHTRADPTPDARPVTRPRTKSVTDGRGQPNIEILDQRRGRSQSQEGVVKGKNVVRDVTSRARRNSNGSVPDSTRPRPNETLPGRRNSISEGVSTQNNEPVNITFGRKIPDAPLLEDITNVHDKIGGNLTTKDVLEKLAQDFGVTLAANDTEQQVLDKLKKNRVINQDDFDFVNANVTSLKATRKIPDRLLHEGIANAKAQSIETEFSVRAILEQLAQDFGVTLAPNDTEQQVLDKLKTDRVINQSDYDFIVINAAPIIQALRIEARERADKIANFIIENQVSTLQATAEKDKEAVVKGNEDNARNQLSRKQKEDLGLSTGTDRYKNAKVQLDAKIKELSQSAIAQIDSELENNRIRLKTEGLAAEKQKQYKAFGDFLNKTHYHPFSFDALNVCGNFQDAAELVELVKRKPNLQTLVTNEHYNLLNDCRRVMGEDVTSAILNRISPTTLEQFHSVGDDGLILLAQLHSRTGIADNKLSDVGNKIQEIHPLVKPLSAKKI